MQQRMIHQHEGHHGFGNRRGTDTHAGVVATVRFDRDRLPLLIDRFARHADAGRRLDAEGDDHILTGRNPAKNAAGVKFEFVPWTSFADRFLNELNSKGKLCDLIIGYASGADIVDHTNPYYRSTYVLVVRSDAVVEQRPVILGQSIAGLREVVSGLAAGDSVIVSGMQRARPGQSVTPTLRDMSTTEEGRP